MKKKSEKSSKELAAKEPVVVHPAAGRADKASTPANLLWVLSLVVAIAAAAGSAYVWQIERQQLQLLQTVQADTAGAIQRVDTQASDTQQLQRQLDRQNDSANQQQQQLQAQVKVLQQQLVSQQKRLQSLSTTDRKDWLLAEAEYLMRLASQRLLMGKEIKGALELLSAADAIVLELDDSALFPVREALAEDMAALRAAGRVDLEGLYLQLAAVAKQVDQLRLIEMPQLEAVAKEIQRPENWQQRLESGFQSALETLNHYIQIKRRDDIYQPLLAPEYEAAVRQNIHLMFEQAQMASLSGKQRLYLDSLSKAKKWLGDYYTLDQQSTAAVITMIDQLALQQVAVTLPDISSSLRSLKSYLQLIHDVKPLPKSDTVTGETGQ